MPEQSDKKYQVEHWVRSNLVNWEANSTKSWVFKVEEAEVSLFLPAPDHETEGFCASTTLTASSVQEAEHWAHDTLLKVLNVLVLKAKARAKIDRTIRSQVEGTGNIRHCAVYWLGKPGVPVLWDDPAREVQYLLNTTLSQQTERTLSWLRWADSAQTIPEAFVFLHMALEQLVGIQRRESTCERCQKPLCCPEHGASTHPSVNREEIKRILDRDGVTLSRAAIRLRNKLIHGGMDYDAEEWMAMIEVYHPLRAAVIEELRKHLPQSEACSGSSPEGLAYKLVSANCQYETAYPSEPFPPDCITSEDIPHYGSRPREGIEILQWPPGW